MNHTVGCLMIAGAVLLVVSAFYAFGPWIAGLTVVLLWSLF